MLKIKQIFRLFSLSKIKLIQKINTLENNKDTLENAIKSELYKTFMEKLKEPQEICRLTKENKRLREKNKTLRMIIKEDKY